MQTFLPYPDFKKSMQCLDYRRLGKQRVEAQQILNILEGKTKSNAWINHPAVKMWKGYEDALKCYLRECINEWIRRGYKNNMIIPTEIKSCCMPWWFGNNEFHASHRSNLKRKKPDFYVFAEADDLPYLWPKK
jgi:hypothetical protein